MRNAAVKLPFALWVFPALLVCADQTFYVSPKGSDAAPGTEAKPLATLAAARDAARRGRAPGSKATIYLRGGLHEVASTVVLSHEDSGTVIAAYPGERPVLTASREVTGWKKESGNVWSAPAPRGSHDGRFFTLFDGKGMLPRARSAGFTPLSLPPEERNNKSVVRFPPGAMPNWPNLTDAELVIRPQHVWVLNILPLVSVDEAAGVARTSIPATYPMLPIGKTTTAWVENVREALDEPGEWLLDSRAGKVYLIPRSGAPAGIRAPRLTEVLRIEGGESGGKPARGITLRGLSFEHGDRDLWTKDDAGLQHDWEMFDKANALVRLRGAEDCAIEHCRFSHSGGTGLRLDLHAQRNRIASNVFAHLGGSGIVLSGYGAGTRDVNHHNEVINNEIHHTGEVYWHGLGILVSQSGENRIANNRLHHLPYTGIVVSGPRPGHFRNPTGREWGPTMRMHEIALPAGKNETPDFRLLAKYLHARNNVVEDNELYRVMEVLGDGNAIYVSGAGLGNRIRRNYVHDIAGAGAQSAIRIDDMQEGVTIDSNIVFRCVSGGITLKHVNRVENNIVAALAGDERRPLFGYILLRRGPIQGASIQRNILFHDGGAVPFYDEARIKQWPLAYARDANTDSNLYYYTGGAGAAQAFLEAKRKEGIDKRSVAADPLFADWRAGDFSLKPGSPALALGFIPIEQSKIGLLRGVAPGPEGLGGERP